VRLRDQHFCDSLVRRTAVAGQLTDDVLIDAALDAYSFVNRPATLRKARATLRKSEIQERIRTVYESQDFDLIDAVDLHVKRIRGQVEQKSVTTNAAGGNDDRCEIGTESIGTVGLRADYPTAASETALKPIDGVAVLLAEPDS